MGEQLAGWIEQHGAWLVGVIIFLESMGVPMPGESVLIAVSIYAATQGGLSIEWVVLSAAAGAILGDNAGYWIGRRAGAAVIQRYGPRIGLTRPRQRLGQYLFQRHGPKVVFFGRFTAFLRTFAAVLAGANLMPWRAFLFYNALGGIAWTFLYGFGAYALGNQVHHLAGPIAIAAAAVTVAAVIWACLALRRGEARLILKAEAALAKAAPTP